MKQHIRWTSWLGLIVICIGIFFILPEIASAQGAPPQPSLRKSLPPWLGMLIMALLVVIVMAVSLMPSRRGRQD